MEIITTYFFDSYAFFEIIEGNPNYDLYFQDVGILTSKLNLMEVHYGLLNKYGKEIADKYYDRLLPFSIDVDDEIIKTANAFKSTFKKRDLSYVDSIGYTLAKARHVKFLTGDKQFEDMENVEFVK